MISNVEDSRTEFKIKLVDDNGKVIGLKNNIDLLERQVKDRIISNIEPSVLGLFDIEVLEENKKKYLNIIVSKHLYEKETKFSCF